MEIATERHALNIVRFSTRSKDTRGSVAVRIGDADERESNEECLTRIGRSECSSLRQRQFLVPEQCLKCGMLPIPVR